MKAKTFVGLMLLAIGRADQSFRRAFSVLYSTTKHSNPDRLGPAIIAHTTSQFLAGWEAGLPRAAG